MESVERALFFPEPMLDHIQREAARLDRSLSWCVQRAWTIAGARVAGLAPGESDEEAAAVCRRLFPEPSQKRKQTLFFPGEMAGEIEAAAARQERSFSWLVQQAFCLAVDELARLPTS